MAALTLFLVLGVWGNTTDVKAPEGKCVALKLSARGFRSLTITVPRILIDHDKNTVTTYWRKKGLIFDGWCKKKTRSLSGVIYSHQITSNCPSLATQWKRSARGLIGSAQEDARSGS